MNSQDFLPILNTVLVVALAIGGFFAFKRGYSKETGEIQGRLIVTLKDEVKALRDKVDDLEKERATQDRVIATIRYALRQYGLRITIAGDFVTLQDTSGKSKTTPVQSAQVKPIMKTPTDDDTDAI